ncbi:hypothetical protein [Cryptosporangium sp. NPDC048952]
MTDEPWSVTRAQFGLSMYAVETDAEVVEQLTALPASALPCYAGTPCQ